MWNIINCVTSTCIPYTCPYSGYGHIKLNFTSNSDYIHNKIKFFWVIISAGSQHQTKFVLSPLWRWALNNRVNSYPATSGFHSSVSRRHQNYAWFFKSSWPKSRHRQIFKDVLKKQVTFLLLWNTTRNTRAVFNACLMWESWC